jgi:anthranilate phosphoribosyltransferase
MLDQLTAQLAASTSLTDQQVRLAVGLLVDELVPATAKADFLITLARKGETTEEIAAFARELRALSVQPVLDSQTRAGEILDVVGTGGDRLSTFNISTTVQVSVLPSDTSASRRFTIDCNRRGFRPGGLELCFVTSPFQPPRVWGAHY